MGVPVCRPVRSAPALVRLLALVVALTAPSAAAAQGPSISITNSCAFSIWLGQTPNSGFAPLPSSNPNPGARLDSGQTANYSIPADGWGGRFWPKTGCDSDGNNCQAGSSVPPCPATGCQPPADTKVEFFYSPLASGSRPYYDITLVDGYALPVKIVPSQSDGGRCTQTNCALSLAACPSDEIGGLGNLQVVKDGQVVQCLSPCKRWNYPPPWGQGKPETQQPGEQFCCPTPPVSPGECRAGLIEQTKYVSLVRAECPSAYSYTYDDTGGSHDCPPGTSFVATICP